MQPAKKKKTSKRAKRRPALGASRQERETPRIPTWYEPLTRLDGRGWLALSSLVERLPGEMERAARRPDGRVEIAYGAKSWDFCSAFAVKQALEAALHDRG